MDIRFFFVFVFFVSVLSFLSSCERPGRPSSQRLVPDMQNLTDIQTKGKNIYHNNCIACHGANGQLKLNGATDLTISRISMEETIDLIKNGRKAMLAFGGILSEDDINAVSEYIQVFKQ